MFAGRAMRCFINIAEKFQWSISIINVFGALVSSIYHLIIFLIIWDGSDSDGQNQIAGIKKKKKKMLNYHLFHKLSFGGSNNETLIILDVYWNISGIMTLNALSFWSVLFSSKKGAFEGACISRQGW